MSEELKEYLESVGIDPWEAALYGGEEFHLVATVDPGGLRELSERFEEVGSSLFVIGRVIREKGVFIARGEEVKRARPGGWDHFSRAIS